MSKFKLVNETTGAEVKEGDAVLTFRGEPGILSSARAPDYDGADAGKVFVKMHGANNWARIFYPSVIGCKWVEVQE